MAPISIFLLSLAFGIIAAGQIKANGNQTDSSVADRPIAEAKIFVLPTSKGENNFQQANSSLEEGGASKGNDGLLNDKGQNQKLREKRSAAELKKWKKREPNIEIVINGKIEIGEKKNGSNENESNENESYEMESYEMESYELESNENENDPQIESTIYFLNILVIFILALCFRIIPCFFF